MFRQLFEEGLELQKVRLREQRAYAREQRLEHQRRHQDQIKSMENYYKDQVGHNTHTALMATNHERERWCTKQMCAFVGYIHMRGSGELKLSFCCLSFSFHYWLKNLHKSGRRSRFGKGLKKRYSI